jgi:tetratricopeptide (TPR) repeat protein
MKKSIYFIFLVVFSNILLANTKSVLDSQPELLNKYDSIKKQQERLNLKVDFNRAVLLLEQEEYYDAIELFKRTREVLKVPSILNLGVAHYKLMEQEKDKNSDRYKKLRKNVLIYFGEVFNIKEAAYSHTYSFMSASYYLYEITLDEKYLKEIVLASKKPKKLDEHSKRLVVDTYIKLKQYNDAIDMLSSMRYPHELKRAMLYIKVRDMERARLSLEKALDTTVNQNTYNKILWLMTFRALKDNNLEDLKEVVDKIIERRRVFKSNKELPLKIFFNRQKYTPAEHLAMVRKFNFDKKVEYLFYFAPFIFSDNEEVFYDSSKGFIFKDDQNLESLQDMVDYNNEFLNLVKKDPIERRYELEKLLTKDTKSYIYYNLGLASAQIGDYHTAYKYFFQSYKLNPGNKVYGVMTLIAAKKVKIKVPNREYIEQNVLSRDGMYVYFGQKLYRMFISAVEENKKDKKKKKSRSIEDDVSLRYKNTVFFKALTFLEEMEKDQVTLEENIFFEDYDKDPLVYLLKLVQKRENETQYQYITRIQNQIPLKINDNFLDGSQIVTQFYVEVLQGVGLLHKADLNKIGSQNPSYLRTKALNELYHGDPDLSVKILNYLRDKYRLEDKYTLYMEVASYLELGQYNDAIVTIELIKAILKDEGANFLIGVQLLQDLKLRSAKQYFTNEYNDSFIDFKLENFDEYLESL